MASKTEWPNAWPFLTSPSPSLTESAAKQLSNQKEVETLDQIDWFNQHSFPAHTHDWRTPNGHTISSEECKACCAVTYKEV